MHGRISKGKVLFGHFFIGIFWQIRALLQQMHRQLWHDNVEFNLLRAFLLHHRLLALAYRQQRQSQHQVILRFCSGFPGGLVDEQSHHGVLHLNLHVEDDLLDQLPEKVHGVALVQLPRLLLLQNLSRLLPHRLLEIIRKTFVRLQVHLQSLRRHLNALSR